MRTCWQAWRRTCTSRNWWTATRASTCCCRKRFLRGRSELEKRTPGRARKDGPSEFCTKSAPHPRSRRCSVGIVRVGLRFLAGADGGEETEVVRGAAEAGVQVAGAGAAERAVVRSVQSGAGDVRDLRAAPVRGSDFVPDCGTQAGGALRYGDGDWGHQEGGVAADEPAGGGGQFSHAQRSCGRQLAIPVRV